MKPGDIVFFHGPNFFSRLIRFGQSLRFRKERKPFAYWNHVGIVVDIAPNGQPVIVEAVAKVRMGPIWTLYDSHEYDIRVVSLDMYDADRAQVVNYALEQVGDAYDWLQIVALAIKLLIGGKLTFGFANAHICSGLVGTALERAGITWDEEAANLMPADLAERFNVL